MSFRPDVQLPSLAHRHKFAAYLLVCESYNRIVDNLMGVLSDPAQVGLTDVKVHFNEAMHQFFTRVPVPASTVEAVEELLHIFAFLPHYLRRQQPQAAALLQGMLAEVAETIRREPDWEPAPLLGVIHECGHGIAQNFFHRLAATRRRISEDPCAMRLIPGNPGAVPASYHDSVITLRFLFEHDRHYLEWFERLPFAIMHEYTSHHQAHLQLFSEFSDGWMVAAQIYHLDEERSAAPTDNTNPVRRLSHQQARACHHFEMISTAANWADDASTLLDRLRHGDEEIFWQVTDEFCRLAPEVDSREAEIHAGRMLRFMRKLRENLGTAKLPVLQVAIEAARGAGAAAGREFVDKLLAL